MKILLCGVWGYDIYEAASAKALRRLGVEVVPFSWAQSFRSGMGRLENWVTFAGWASREMNRGLLDAAQRHKPDVIFIWRPTLVLSSTLRKLRRCCRAALVCYNNDDPWSPWYQRQFPRSRLWKYFVEAIPEYDLHFVYRQVNVEDMRQAGARRVALLRSYFVPEVHRPITLGPSDRERFQCDVVFVGHYEPDGRMDCLRALVKAGLRVRLFGGTTWTAAVLGDLASYFGSILPVLGDDYSKAVCGARVALSFLSTLNRDTYTRRSFEIPACKTLMLSERTPELQSLFVENEEVVFFSGEAELVEKATKLVAHDQLRNRIAEAGWRRVYSDGHSVEDRMRECISILNSM